MIFDCELCGEPAPYRNKGMNLCERHWNEVENDEEVRRCKMRERKKLRVEIDKWVRKNGACDIDIKEENIRLFNGGLWQECNKNYSELWIGDLDNTIRYLKRLRDFLNKKGFDTRRSAQDWLIDNPNQYAKQGGQAP